ncbi:hypothetical protein M2164_006451 [Streptomyces sp. SAI-208]|uniref:hypothetical protein n=1 Tax=unclassified Streptomyces TaxID=2593676 RepID=UPI002473F750|nr:MULTISPECIES: hypothetical protein [unclassified Streptomyces]MDH6519839.1 hypothetical protein [Streptomyces sp. SAI-090]MDH6552047.1 hypothetical protein [Streptomyces sp. SAI-041]MDH6571141.1 hypothetical protein [Streptomyces sp. SAI-117]MDH6583893.1 hypothetical protein [Streptomyces sp. SAI-133]MDH6610816.1 hypothetical protein [Streptomyces sp. SAI-208]
MKFVQIIGFETERLEEMRELMEEAGRRNAGREGGPTHRMLLKDRDKPNHYLALIEFDSYDEAMRNSDDPETGKLAEQLGALSMGERVYINCDVLESGELK